MFSIFTALFIIRILFIRLNKLARFDLSVKQKQPKATEVSELIWLILQSMYAELFVYSVRELVLMVQYVMHTDIFWSEKKSRTK